MTKKQNYTCEELMNLLCEHANSERGRKKRTSSSEVEYRLGVSTSEIRKIAKATHPNLKTSKCLWNKKTYESRMLAVLVCPVEEVKASQVKQWLSETESWAICDLIANEIISHNKELFAHCKDWAKEEKLFVKRGAISSIACHAQDLTQLSEKEFDTYAEIIWFASDDDRKYIKNACSWAIRELGKINLENKDRAISLSEKMIEDENKSRNWVGKDAMKELKTLIKVSERPRLLSSESSVGKKYKSK